MPDSDHLLKWITRFCAGLVAFLLLLVMLFLFRESIPALKEVGPWRFVSDESWHPLSNRFNLLPIVLATLITSFGAILLAGPCGIASAVFCRFYAPRPVSFCYRRLLELLAGIPSVVYGLWGLVVLVPLISTMGGSGQNILSATLILALMILPTVALTSFASLQSVPKELVSGGAALGLGRLSIVRRIVIPAARHGIASGLLLALARALGETMAVLMVAGNVVQLPNSITSPVRTLTANIALEMGYATSSHRSILFVSGLVLMSVVVFIVLFIELFGGEYNEE